ncbi:MAG: choice-of-anchor D domain-containing protein [Candidatus Sulfotelmatobacter sp.]
MKKDYRLETKSSASRISQFGNRLKSLTLIGLAVAFFGVFPVRGNDRTAAPPAVAHTPNQLLAQTKVLKLMGQLPLSFEANAGQVDSRVKFLSRGPGYNILLTEHGAVLAIKNAARKTSAQQEHSNRSAALIRGDLRVQADPASSPSILRMQLLGANGHATISGLERQSGSTNYFLGKDPRNWHTNVANYGRVRYENVYPGVDLVYYGNQGRLEYDFVVQAGSNPHSIRLNFGSDSLARLDKATGDLVIRTLAGDVRFQKPVAYQPAGAEQTNSRSVNTNKHFVNSRFVLQAKNVVTFQVDSYDTTEPLVIDPVLSYSTYLGGTSNDYATSIAVDSSGSAYITGYTTSANFPVTPGAYQTTCGGGTCTSTTIDAFVTKLNPSGTALEYSTYLGGSSKDYGYGIAVDPNGDAFIAGTTFSSNFPVTSGAFQKACGGNSCASGDGFVTELNSTGSGLVYSTYLGGVSVNQANAIALDSSGDAYITGYTKSSSFPVTAGAFQPKCSSCTKGTVDSFVTKLNSSGSALVYSSYLGGNNGDTGYAIAVDASGNAYVTGYTYSTNFPTTVGAFQRTSGAATAAFVSKVNPAGTALSYSTYLGGSGTSTSACAACATGIAVDATGDAYVVGLTWETNFPTTTGAYQTSFAGGFHDAFATKLNPSGSGVIYSTYIGGTGDDGATSVVLDSTGTAYLKGNTFSTNFPTTPGAFQNTLNGSSNSDAFVVILNPAGSALNYSTYIGGSSNEYGSATAMIAIDSQTPPDIYITGYGNSADFPVTPGAFQTKLAGQNDGFVSKFAPSPNVGLSPALNFGNQNDGTTSAPETITVTNTGNSTLTISSVGISGSNQSDFNQTNNCTTAEVAPQSTCAINVTFSPTISGTENATVTLTDDAPDSPESTSLTGIGVGAGPAVTISPTSLVFATQLVNTTSPPQTVMLTNIGTGPLSITSIIASGNFAQTNTCGTAVAAGASCTISVTFTPSTVNTRTGSITVTDNAPGSPQIVSLTGTGTYVTYTPTSLNFGTEKVGSSSAPQTITFTNHAGSALMIKSVTTTGVDNLDFIQTNTCGTSLAKLSSCTITVTFKPLATGSRTADVTISDFIGGNASQNIPLSGTGQ